MGLFSSLFSSKPDYPPLDPQSSAAQRIAEVAPQLKELASKVSDPLEIVPSEHAAYVFIGKPPKSFGMAWVHDGKVSGLNTLVEEHDMKPAEIAGVVDELRSAYEHCNQASRFCADVEGKTLVVTPSEQLEREVHEIIDKLVH